MLLSKSLVESFQALYINKCGVEISYTAAEAQLKELADIVRLTSKAGVL